MPDGHAAPPARWADEFRRVMDERRRAHGRLLIIGALVGCSTVPLAASLVLKMPLVLVWNASASAPVGLYRLHTGEPVRRGEMAIARIPGPSRPLAARRHYLPANVPLVKRVAAVAGDRVCAAGAAVSINGKRVAVRRRSDGAGRPMPWWIGCYQLRAQEYFLLTGSPLSFDGRYFGLTRGKELLGRADLLWAKPSRGSNDE
jgi:conjugative transfer signal peptidase TraF